MSKGNRWTVSFAKVLLSMRQSGDTGDQAQLYRCNHP
jgi:hypothetical protein